MLRYVAKMGQAIAIVLSLTIPSHAAECGKRDKVVAFLADRYKEVRRAIGIVGNRGIMELFVSKKGTWTVLMTNTDKLSCIVAAGESFQRAKGFINGPEA